MVDTNNARFITVVKFRSRLSAEEIERRYKERMPEFRQVPGLVQKFYVQDESSGEWGGIYLWDSKEALESYLGSDLRKTIGAAYEVEGAPRVETFTIREPLRT